MAVLQDLCTLRNKQCVWCASDKLCASAMQGVHRAVSYLSVLMPVEASLGLLSGRVCAQTQKGLHLLPQYAQ
eukprot:6386814-Amphidinium_carterae.1